jgi:hypothetical protein
MKELAIFTAPKPFTDPHINLIQRNAIGSWRDMGGEVEVYLVGEEDGTAAAAAELGVDYLPEVQRNKKGTPLVSSIFDVVRAASQAPFLAYVNADIIMFPGTLSVIQDVARRAATFAMMGQRFDLDVHEPLDFSGSWPESLRREMTDRGQLHAPSGSDYFIFPRHLYTEIPDFAIGRAGWDNWMIYHAVTSPWLAIDGTAALDVVHQQHDYAHLDGGKPHYRLDESETNVQLAGGQIYMLLDIQYEYREGRIQRKRMSLLKVVRTLERQLQPVEQQKTGWRWTLLRRLRAWRRQLVGG